MLDGITLSRIVPVAYAVPTPHIRIQNMPLVTQVVPVLVTGCTAWVVLSNEAEVVVPDQAGGAPTFSVDVPDVCELD